MKRKSPKNHRRKQRAEKNAKQWGIITLGDVNWVDSGQTLYFDGSATATTMSFDSAGFTAGDIITISGAIPPVVKIKNPKNIHPARRRKMRKKAENDGTYIITEVQGNTITVQDGDTITLNTLYAYCKEEWSK